AREPRQGFGIRAAAHRLDARSRLYEPTRGPPHEFLQLASLVGELSPAVIISFSDPAEPVELIDQRHKAGIMTFAQLYPSVGIRLAEPFQQLAGRLDIAGLHGEDETANSFGKLQTTRLSGADNPLGGEKRASVMAQLVHPAALPTVHFLMAHATARA